jgi:hypothetical protein
MGNIGGLYRRGGLKVATVFPTYKAVVDEFFSETFVAVSRDNGIALEWKHPDDVQTWGDTAMMWWQQNGAKVGGKHIRAGTVGYWVMAVIEHETAYRLPGNVRIFDEGVGETWAAEPGKYPTLWHYVRAHRFPVSQDWPDFVQGVRRTSGFLLDHIPAGLPPRHLGSIPDWVRDDSTPAEEAWYTQAVEEESRAE